ncbi:MAG: hypothetical protein MR549_02630 [Lachnobacterium sp.]|nr:hypothetical protein [Lachnobacterium sp.]
MFSCPNCGGNLKFDIPSQQLSCEYCHELFNPYAFEDKKSDAEEEKSYESDYEVTIFTCPQCGGEILSTDNAAAGFCSFCGASTILYSRISHERRPNYIIPFQKSKEDCKNAYRNLMRRAIFAPKELKDPKYIDSFRGIYMPYWAYYVTQQGSFCVKGKKEYRRGDYIYKDYYNLSGNIDAYYKGLSYDASSSFADNISEQLAPYDVKGMKAFTPSFLSGFYADTADVAPSIYQGNAKTTAQAQTLQQIKNIPDFKSYDISASMGKNDSFHTETKEVDSTMFPVWFMSYRNKDRVAYITVNGQTGKLVADLPIDPKKYILGSIFLAMPIFLFLVAFITLLPSWLTGISMTLAIATIVLTSVELYKIKAKDSDANDRGKQYIKEVSGAPVPPVTSSEEQKEEPPKKKNARALCVIAAIVSLLILIINPVSDIFYYAGAIFCLVAVLISIIDVIRFYNVLSTRRLPQFDKQGGDDRA